MDPNSLHPSPPPSDPVSTPLHRLPPPLSTASRSPLHRLPATVSMDPNPPATATASVSNPPATSHLLRPWPPWTSSTWTSSTTVANRNGGVKEEEVRMVSDDRASSIFGEFMSRTAKFEDLVNNIGHQFLTGFCWELEIFKRPHIYKTSDVVDNIIEANQTERMKAYVDAGCRQRHHDVQNMCNIHSCRQGLEDHLTKGWRFQLKLLLDELETLKKEAMDISWMVNDGSSRTFDPNFDDGVEYEGLPLEEGNTMDSMGIQNKSISYATLMTVVYNMLKLDYAMQEKIISSVSLMDTSSEQVESYCTMWDLRPYVDDNVMRQAWKFVR